jgi:iron complex outermembrane receptor protein
MFPSSARIHLFLAGFAAAPCALAAPPAPLAAAVREQPVPLEKFNVTSDRTTSLTVPSLDDARIDLARTPGGTETIAAERYLRGRASTVNDLFALSPGISAQSRFGSDEARISIRGSGLQRTFHGRGLRILQDGVPVNLADGSFDMQTFEPLAAAYVNVWRGANALAFGASTLGGAIDFVSRTGRDAPETLRVEAGSFGYLRAFVAGGFATRGTDGYVAVTRTEQDGFRAHARQRNARVFGNLGWRHTDAVESRFYLTAVSTDSELPGSLLQAEVKSTPRIANPVTAAQHQKRDYGLLRAASKTTARLGQTVWDASLGWTYKDLDHPIAPVVDQLAHDHLAALTATHTGNLAGRANRLKAGFMWTHNEVRAANFVNVGGVRGALTARARQRATNTELWLEDQLTVADGLTLVAGYTFAAIRRVNRQEVGGAGSYTRTYDNLSPKLGFRWDGPGVQVFGNVSGSFEPPSFSETGALAAPNRAQRARTVELGTRGARGPVRWDATVYAARLKDEFLSLNDANGNPLGTINAPRTTHAGVEVFGELDLLGVNRTSPVPASHRLLLRAAWTYGRFRFDDHPVYRNNTLAGFPPHVVRAELAWEHPSGWHAGPTLEWVPRRAPVDFANTLFADPYSLFGFRVGRRIDRGLCWFAELRNAFERHHTATTGVIADARGLDARQFLPGETRAFYTGIEHTW